MSSRDPEHLTPVLYGRWLRWDYKMDEAGLSYLLTCVDRTEAEQTALFAQGRSPLWIVNQYRKTAGLPPLAESENHKVTWTLHSRHIVNKDQPLSRALDFAIVRPGTRVPKWTLKIDTNESGGPDYLEAGKAWESVGGEWGGRFKNPDAPHCQ